MNESCWGKSVTANKSAREEKEKRRKEMNKDEKIAQRGTSN